MKSRVKQVVVFVLLLFFSKDIFFGQDVKPTPTLTGEENILLVQAKKWISEHLKCKQFSQNDYRVPDFDKAPTANCSEINNVVFGHYAPSGELGLVLEADGGNWLGPHAVFVMDEKFVYCHFSDSKFTATAFDQRESNSNIELMSFSKGPDLIVVRDPAPSVEGISNTCVYADVNNSMKNVLNFNWTSDSDHGLKRLETRLIPMRNRDLRLLTLNIDGFLSSGTYSNFESLKANIVEIIYSWDAVKQTYLINEKPKELSLIKTAFRWFYKKDEKSIYYSGPTGEIFNNRLNLEELICYLKLDEKNSLKDFAHSMLKYIAGEDLGYEYEVWEKWKNKRVSDEG